MLRLSRPSPDRIYAVFGRGLVTMAPEGQLDSLSLWGRDQWTFLPSEDIVQRRINMAVRDLTGLPATLIRRRDEGTAVYLKLAPLVEGIQAEYPYSLVLEKKTGMVMSCALRNCVPGPPDATIPVISGLQAVAIGIKAVQDRYTSLPLKVESGPDFRVTNMTYLKRSEVAGLRELTARERQHLEAGGSLLVYCLSFTADDKPKTIYFVRVSAVTGRVLTLDEYPPR